MSRFEGHRERRTSALSRVAVAALLFLGSLAAIAQTNRGGITGTVFDPSHSVISGASVTITNLGTNQKFQATSSANGAYTVLALEPVEYSVTVSAPGFRTATVDRVKVDTAAVATVDVSLLPGAVSSEVTVQATTAAINTESGTTSSTVSERQLTDIPLVNRSVLDLAMTQPNVMGEAGTEDPGMTASATVPGYNLSVNGGRPGSSGFLADGVNNTGVSLARTMVSFSPETVQEFTVQSSAYSAEYGNVGGGIINATTKSGTNNLNGSVLWYNRNPMFAAPNYLGMPAGTSVAKTPQPTLKYNQFAFTAGGPVYIPKIYNGKNKTFWFFGFEPRYRRDHLDQWAILPTDAMRQGDFSNTVLVYQAAGKNQGSTVRVPVSVQQRFNLIPTGADGNIYNHYDIVNVNGVNQLQLRNSAAAYTVFQNNIIPAEYHNASALKAMQYITPYGGDNSWFVDPNGNIQNLYNPRTLEQDDKRYTVRIDHNFSEKNLLNGRYTTTPLIKKQYTPSSITSMGSEYTWAKQAMVSYTHLFSSTVYNDLRINYTRGRFSQTVAPQWDLISGGNLNTELGLPSYLKGGLPSLPWIGGQSSTQTEDIEERYGITDMVYVTKGNMSWKFGVDLGYALQNVTPLYGAIGGVYDFRALQTSSGTSSSSPGGDQMASFLMGVPNAATFRPTIIRYYYRWKSLAGFVQNDWKVRPNLTLNLGVRYNLTYPRTEKYDHQGAFIMDQDKTVSVPYGGVYLRNPNASINDPGLWYPLSSITMPTYSFTGAGRSQYLFPVDYKGIEPRFGFAWAPSVLANKRITIKGGYAMSHIPPTGVSRVPNPDYSGTASAGATISGLQLNDAQGNAYTNTCCAIQLGVNNPYVPAQTADQYIFGKLPSNRQVNYDGAQAVNSLMMGGFVLAPNMKTPDTQNWNLGLAWQATSSISVELSYVGNKGTHLYSDAEMVNARPSSLIDYLNANNINPNSTTIVDPLNRLTNSGTCSITYTANPVNPSMAPYVSATKGSCTTIAPGSLASRYVGFSWGPYMLFDSSNNSNRHAGYVNFVYRGKNGLTITSNYTMGKSIDDGSGPNDKFVLTAGQNAGQASFGAPRSSDRSVSMFDQKHVWNTTFIYDLPFGRNHRLLANLWGPLNYMVEGWTISGISRVLSGFPAWTTLVDNNQMGDSSRTHTIRPNIVAGVPLKNPLWDRNCVTGSGCQPYLNPLAFERPALGQYGNAPRTLDSVRGPWMRYFDGSIQKNFRLGEGKRRLQFRADLLNAFNHPNFRVGPNSSFTDFTSQPAGGTTAYCVGGSNGGCSTAAPYTNFNASINVADFNNWVKDNGMSDQQVTTSTRKIGSTNYTVVSGAGLALYQQVNNTVNAQRTNNVLPSDFFSVQLPAGFNTANATSYDIRTVQGYKYYRLRQSYNTSFGTLYNPSGSSRYMQFGLKLFF